MRTIVFTYKLLTYSGLCDTDLLCYEDSHNHNVNANPGYLTIKISQPGIIRMNKLITTIKFVKFKQELGEKERLFYPIKI